LTDTYIKAGTSIFPFLVDSKSHNGFLAQGGLQIAGLIVSMGIGITFAVIAGIVIRMSS